MIREYFRRIFDKTSLNLKCKMKLTIARIFFLFFFFDVRKKNSQTLVIVHLCIYNLGSNEPFKFQNKEKVPELSILHPQNERIERHVSKSNTSG